MRDSESIAERDPDTLFGASIRGKEVSFVSRIVGKSSRKILHRTATAHCSTCDLSVKLDIFSDPEVAEYFIGNHRDQYIATKSKMALVLQTEGCEHGFDKSLRIHTTDNADYIVLRIEGISRRSDRQRYTVHLLGHQVPDGKIVKFFGYGIKNLKSGDAEVIATRYEPLQDTLSNFMLTEDDKTTFPIFREGNVHLSIAPHIVGKTREIGKMVHALVDHSVLEIRDIDNQRTISGTLNALFVGRTVTGKTETAKSFSDQDETLGMNTFSEYVNAETAARTGLAYSINSDLQMIEWGVLVTNDRREIVLDGLDRFPSDELGQLREIIRQGVVVVTRCIRGRADARCRIIATANPVRPEGLEGYSFPVNALTDIKCFTQFGDFDATELTRWDLFVPFKADVSADEIAYSTETSRPIRPEVYCRHVMWAWTRKPDDVLYAPDAVQLIKDETSRLLKSYESARIPLVNKGLRPLLTKLSAATACLLHHTDESQEKVIVDCSMVQQAVSIFEKLLHEWELDSYLQEVERPSHTLTEDDFLQMVKEFDEVDVDIVMHLAAGAKTADQLAEAIGGIEGQTLRKIHFPRLKKWGLIETRSARGALLTQKGTIFFRRLRPSRENFVDSLTKSQRTMDKFDTFVDRESTNQRTQEYPPIDEKLSLLVKMHESGASEEEMRNAVGDAIYEHAEERGLISKFGGREE